jgi:hypothetical protein
VADADGEHDHFERRGPVESADVAGLPAGLRDDLAELSDRWSHADARDGLHAEWTHTYYRGIKRCS